MYLDESSHRAPSSGFVPQIQSTALHDESLTESENQDITSSEINRSKDITVI